MTETDPSRSLHHVGIATTDRAATAALFGDLLACEVVHTERFDGLDIAFLAVGGCYIELLEPIADGPVDRFLDREGPGIHHLAFATPDIERALDRATNRGIEAIDAEPRPGAWGHSVAFLHPGDTGGVLIEFVEESV